MARTIQQIYDAIIAEKQNFTSLNELQPLTDSSQSFLTELTTKSRVAVWRFYIWIVAFAQHLHEVRWDAFKNEVQEIANAARAGTLPWYRSELLKYQHGDALVYKDNRFQYELIDVTKQIVEQSAAIEVGGQVRLRAATTDSTGSLIPLSASQLAGLRAYAFNIKIAGSDVVVSSDTPDLLKLKMDIYYDPLVLTADGSLISTPSNYPAETAINEYLKGLDFEDGEFVVNKLVDAVQAAQGVKNPVPTLVQSKFAGFGYTDIEVSVKPNAGYMRIDDNFPLRTELNYIAKL